MIEVENLTKRYGGKVAVDEAIPGYRAGVANGVPFC